MKRGDYWLRQRKQHKTLKMSDLSEEIIEQELSVESIDDSITQDMSTREEEKQTEKEETSALPRIEKEEDFSEKFDRLMQFLHQSQQEQKQFIHQFHEEENKKREEDKIENRRFQEEQKIDIQKIINKSLEDFREEWRLNDQKMDADNEKQEKIQHSKKNIQLKFSEKLELYEENSELLQNEKQIEEDSELLQNEKQIEEDSELLQNEKQIEEDSELLQNEKQIEEDSKLVHNELQMYNNEQEEMKNEEKETTIFKEIEEEKPIEVEHSIKKSKQKLVEVKMSTEEYKLKQGVKEEKKEEMMQ